jgi:transposase
MNMPVVVNFMAAAMNDRQFLKHIQDLPRYSIIVFDKGYESFSYFHDFTQNDIYFVTRQKETAAYTSIEEFDIDQQPDTILKDERIEVIYKVKIGGNIPLQLRRVAFWDESTKRTFVFITNNFELTSIQVADIYKNRWQIESFFKKLKQNFPLVYFLGDNANAIEIQIWCALIALLLLQVIHYGNKSKMAFSLLASLVRQHLMNYVSFASIIANYNRKRPRPKPQNKPKGKPPDLFTPILF